VLVRRRRADRGEQRRGVDRNIRRRSLMATTTNDASTSNVRNRREQQGIAENGERVLMIQKLRVQIVPPT
jgi:hypothetical protein